MKVYVVRHGESEGNARQVHSGQGAFPLTQKGCAQAAETGKLLRDIPFDRIYVSDLLRAQQTAAIMLPDRGADFELRSDIREYDTRGFVGKSFPEMEALYGEKYLQMRKMQDYTDIGGESPEHFVERVSSFMQEMEALENSGADAHNVAVVAHAGVLKCMAQYVLGVPYRAALMPTDNCSVNILQYKDGVWRVFCWNYTPALVRFAPEAE